MIQVSELTKIYKSAENETVVLDKVSFSIRKGEYIAIMGPSGSGKSTLMHILGMLDIATSGSYFFDDRNVSKLSKNELSRIRNKKVGFVFQSFNLLPRATAMNNVILPMLYGGVKKATRQKRAVDLLTNIGLGQRLNHTGSQLSGGEIQRVAIARALAMNPEILLADEPTGNISSIQGKEIMRVFKELNSKGHTIVLITHDPEIARNAQRVIKIQDGKILYDGPTRDSL